MTPPVAAGDIITATYLVPPVTRRTAAPPEGTGAQLVPVPSSARPAAPKVLYAVPTFGWTRSNRVNPSGVNSTRRGAGLRVYLERPWWSSGQGELLGVVTWPAAESRVGTPNLSDDDPLRPFVTHWGEDPVFGSAALPFHYPTLNTFPKRADFATGLTLDELGSSSDRTVNVAAHAVGFDAARGLWYCDIDVAATDAYSPFIRLALARYQRQSIANTELSRVVLADFLQLARTASRPSCSTRSIWPRSRSPWSGPSHADRGEQGRVEPWHCPSHHAGPESGDAGGRRRRTGVARSWVRRSRWPGR